MPSLGSALANTYILPQAQPLAQPKPHQPYQDDIGEPLDAIQQVDKVTSQYFDRWAQLKGFARDVWENYGIDVRYPDPSVPESNRLHRIYLKAIADMKAQGSKLKTSQSMYNASLQRRDIINADPNKQAFSDLQPGVDVVYQTLDPIVTEANNKLQQLYYDSKSLNEAKAYYADIKERLTAKAQQNPNQREYWLRQVEALTPPTSASKQFAERAPSATAARDQRKMESAGALLKQRANLVAGTSDSYKLSDSVFTPDGGRVMVSEDTKGETYGGKEVVRWEHEPETGKTTIVTKDIGGQLSRNPVTNADLMSVVKGTVTENPRYAVPGEYFDMYADENNLRKTTGEFDPSSLIASDAPQRREKVQKEIAGLKAQKESAQLNQLKGKVSELKPRSLSFNPSDWFDGRMTVSGSDGVPVKIAAHDADGKTVYEIENAKGLVTADDYKANKDKYKKMGKQALINFLSKRGAHLGEEVAEPTGAEPATQAAPATKKVVPRTKVTSLVGKPGYEGYTEQELIDYYKGQGYTIE